MMPSSNTPSSEITMMCTLALKGAMAKLGPQYEHETGDKLLITYGSTRGLLDRINKREAVDVVIVTKTALADLLKQGKVEELGHTDVAQSGIGVAIRRGGTRPDISTLDAFKRSLLAAKSVASTNPADGGASGIYFGKLIERLGIAEQLGPKIKFAPGGTSSGLLVASGEAEIAVQMMSELVSIPGSEVVGPLPAELQSFSVFSAGVSSSPADQAAARRLILFLTSPAVAPTLRESGLESPK
jgi:molybdate transport system substrate-binding protein